MYVDPDDLECVAFLCADRCVGAARRIPIATAFFVELPDGFRYLVTARHVVERELGQIQVRLNTRSGSFQFEPAPHERWERSHEADVAALPFSRKPEPRTDLAYRVIPYECFVDARCCYTGPGLTDELRAEGGIPVHLGDDMYSFSLFTARVGEQRNLPVVRFGHISGLPAEPIKVDHEFEVVGYVAELLSWAGHSGSPVFWASGTQVARGKLRNGSEAIAVGRVKGLLGLLSAHFDIPTVPERTRGVGATEEPEDSLEPIRIKLNAGLAVITPAEEIRRLLMREDVVERREGLK